LESADLGDQRLAERYRLLMDTLSRRPSVSLPAACNGRTELTAAYRFFNNELVTAEKVLAPHQQATLARIREQAVVLLVQDTTELDLSRPQERMAGAGPLNEESRWGFYDHPLLALTPERVPLGVVEATIWARDLEEFRKSRAEKDDRERKRRLKSIDEKESRRWVDGYRRACAIAEAAPQTRIVCIADSESDIYECFLAATAVVSGRPADWIIRAAHDRSVVTEADDDAELRNLRSAVAATKVLKKLQIEVRRNEGKASKGRKRNQPRSARMTTVSVQALRVTLKGTPRPGGRLPNVRVNAILIRELDPPEGEERIEWLLLTNLPISSIKQVCRVIEYYCCRWQIEIYFRVLKSGCKVEERQFETADAYLPCLALYMIVAWRVLYVLMLGRECPDLCCDEVFSDEEWKSVYMVVRQKPAPRHPPTLQEMIVLIARLGGHLGRTNDEPPGPKAIWLGMQRMMDLALAWTTFGPQRYH
jgi:hypothetical protein